jgi:hypothetical protein
VGGPLDGLPVPDDEGFDELALPYTDALRALVRDMLGDWVDEQPGGPDRLTWPELGEADGVAVYRRVRGEGSRGPAPTWTARPVVYLFCWSVTPRQYLRRHG